MFNFEVEDRHTYFVGDSVEKSILVHNSCWDNLKYAGGVAWGGVKRTGQGFLNAIKGVQDIAVSVLNIPAVAVNGIAYVEGQVGILNSNDPIYMPYIPSPDWSRNVITEEYGEEGTWSDTHGWSKAVGGDAAATLATLRVTKLASAVKEIDSAMVFDGTYYTLENIAEVVAKQGSKVKTNFSRNSIQHAYSRHGADFGMTENSNRVNLDKFEQILNGHINSPTITEITGTYRGKPVTHFFDDKTQINVMVNPDGSLAGAWKLGTDQITHLLYRGENVQ